WPSQAGGNGFHRTEQAGETTDFAGLVLFAAFNDQVVRVAAGNDLLRVVGRCAQHAHGMVVRQQNVFDGLVGYFANASNDILGHDRRGLGVDHHDGIITNDDAGVRIALGGVGVGVVGQFFKGNDLVFKVGVRGKLFGHGGSP